MKKYTLDEIHAAVGSYAYTLLDKQSLKTLLKAALKSLKESAIDSKFKVGDEVVITDRLHGHAYNIGEAVRIIKVYDDDGGGYDTISLEGDETWAVNDDEIILKE